MQSPLGTRPLPLRGLWPKRDSVKPKNIPERAAGLRELLLLPAAHMVGTYATKARDPEEELAGGWLKPLWSVLYFPTASGYKTHGRLQWPKPSPAGKNMSKHPTAVEACQDKGLSVHRVLEMG